ncbi:MAG TPA: YafY family protein [Acidimicrobiia bacterium]|nr:YafY family protein [Acidimicrobiia bacterium]HEU4917689.1 YafY family protein [Acidimicrobiia bacterium]
MDSAERLLKLLGLLEGRIDWTAEELARRLEVTTRTVRRDITRLRTLGYPVEAVAGPGGGYRLGQGGKLPPLLLDDEEALAVALGLRVAATTAVGGLEDASLSALSKLEHVLPPKLRAQLEDISEATVSTLTTSPSSVDHASLAVAASAARTRQRMRFTYTDVEGRVTERHVEPLRLVHTGRRWYLVGFDLDRDDWRTFRLDRLTDPVATGMRSARRPEPDPVEMVQRGVAIDAYALRATIRMATSMERATQMIPPTIGALESLGPEMTRLVIGADDVQWLARYLLGLPWEFEVDSPDELGEELTRIGRRLIAVHSS